MKAIELLHQINDARQMLQTAADECHATNPDLQIIFDNVSRARELSLDAEFLCGNEIDNQNAKKVSDNLNAKINDLATMITKID